MSDATNLKKIVIKTRRQIFSEISGNNPSIFEGEGFDFVELREYNYGDDVRKIDWNVTAKMQKPYIKVFHEERELNIVIVSLLSGSVYFGQRRLKQDVIAEIGALLAFSSLKNGDLFSSFVYTDEIKKEIKPTKNIHAVEKLVGGILSFDVMGERIDSQNLSKILFNKLKRRSIIFVIGDFFDQFDFKILSKKHEVVALIVRDRLEENPPEFGMVDLVDPQNLSGSLMNIDQKSIKRYKERLHNRDMALYKSFSKHRVSFTKIYTDEEPFVKLSKLFIRG